MTNITAKVREHYNAAGLVDRIKSALEAITPENQLLTVNQLAPVDHFHVRGILATAELADEVKLSPSMRVLDLGCGIGGPARYFAATFGCTVVGIDLSTTFVDAATYLTARCGLSDRVTFQVGDALHTPFEAASFDAVFLHHVAMNIPDRGALYAEVFRVLKPEGRFATHDLVLRDGGGEVLYPTPWASDASTSFLLRQEETRAALERVGFRVEHWSDDTKAALDWLKSVTAKPETDRLNASIVRGQNFPTKAANLAQSMREGRIGVLSAVCTVA
jgi:ubiquinone/menaquinone biosynthesis C-methylase UbiE